MLLNSSYGKLGQTIHDDKLVITSDDNDIDQFYQNGQVSLDTTLVNGSQCLLHLHKQRISQVSDPAHIDVFIIDYSKVLMNRCIAGFDGFTDWNNTFYYTDTDSIYVHNNQIKEIEDKTPYITGKEMGQLHDDIKEVKNGKIIRGFFLLRNCIVLKLWDSMRLAK